MKTVHGRAAFWLLQFFMKHLTPAELSVRIATRLKSHWRQKKGTGMTYSEAGSYLLETHEPDGIIAEIDAYMMRFTQPVK